MDPQLQHALNLTRRQFFGDVGLRVGGIALVALMGDRAARAADAPSAPSPNAAQRVHPPLAGLPHHRPRAKSIIYLHMNGGPSQIDTWDHKPKLQEFFDK